jgi:hypothetical protein
MTCEACGSNRLSTFNGEVAIHFPVLEGLDGPIVWVFPKVVVCLNCIIPLQGADTSSAALFDLARPLARGVYHLCPPYSHTQQTHEAASACLQTW